MKKRISAFVLSLALAVSSILSVNFIALADDITYSFDNEGMVLTISGAGEMTDYNENNLNTRPWYVYAEETKKVVIGEGVTHIGDYAFSRFENLAEVELSSTVTSIGSTAFGANNSLKSITVPETVKEIGAYAFGYDYTMTIPSDFVCYCAANSAAAKYCFANYVPFDAPMVDGTGTAHITEDSGQSVWSFVPKTNGVLEFASKGKKDTFGLIYKAASYVYDKDYGKMKDSAVATNDDSGSDVNFKITYSVTAGERYYLAAKFMINDRYESAPDYPFEDGQFAVTMNFSCSQHTYDVANEELPNCTEAGSRTYECIGCGDTYTEVLDPIGHTPEDAVIENEEAATCDEQGYYDEVVYCAVCTEEISRETKYSDALGHSFTHYVSDENATCTKDGTKTAKCDRCDAIDTVDDEGSALGHDYVSTVTNPTCTNKGYTTYVCSRCPESYVDNYVDELGHSFTHYVSDENATCTEDGTKTAKCDRCDAIDTVEDTDSALGHEYAITAFDGITVTVGCVRCEDEIELTFMDFYNTEVVEESAILDANGDGFINAKDFVKIKSDLKKAQE